MVSYCFPHYGDTVVIIAVVLVLVTMYCVILWEEHQMLVRQARFFAEM